MMNDSAQNRLTAEAIDGFYKRQFEAWPECRMNYDRLRDCRRRTVDVDGFDVVLQHNPARSVSTNARVDAASVASRKCFLCSGNRPEAQLSVGFPEGFDWLVNPYPIFPVHFTIASRRHDPQEEVPLEMAAAAEAAPMLAFFYNGAKAGASAPDHLHFQAVLKDELPLLGAVEAAHNEKCGRVMLSSEMKPAPPMSFVSLRITPDLQGMQLLSAVPVFHGIDAASGLKDRGLANVFMWIDGSGILRVMLTGRSAHRPQCYNLPRGEGGHKVSPGAIDMAGMLIIPDAEDFDSLTAEEIRTVYSEVGLTDTQTAMIAESLFR